MSVLVSAEWARRAVVTWVLAAVGLVSVLLTMTLAVAVWVIFAGDAPLDHVGRLALICGPGTLMPAVVCARRCIRVPRDRADAGRACLGWGAAGGLLATALFYVTFLLVFTIAEPHIATSGDLFEWVGIGIFGIAVVGSLLGCPVGLAFAAMMLAPIRFGCDHSRAHDSAERAAARCGGWVAMMSGLAAAVLFLVLLHVERDGSGGLAVIAAWAAVGTPAIVAFLWGSIRGARRTRWLARVRAGREAGWVVVELDDDLARVDRGLRPFQGGAPSSARFALARVEPGSGSAYRGADHPEPVALVAAS